MDGLNGDQLAAAIQEYERIDELLSKLMSYAQLVYSGNVTDPAIGRFYQGVNERANAIYSDMLFFTLELNRLEDAHVETLLNESAALAAYRPWIRDQRVMRPHQLADDLERLLHEKSVAGRSAWVRLYDQTLAGLRFPMNGEMLTSTQVLDRMSSRDPADDAWRRGAAPLARVNPMETGRGVLPQETEQEDLPTLREYLYIASAGSGSSGAGGLAKVSPVILAGGTRQGQRRPSYCRLIP